MKIFTQSTFVATFLIALCIGFSQQVNSQTQSTMAVRGTNNGFGNDAMTYRSGLATTWITTFQATSTNSSAAFLFANNGSFSPKWARGASVSFNSKTTWFANGADGTYNQTNGNYYTFIFQDKAGGTDSQGYVFETSAAPVSVSTVTQSVLTSSVLPGQAVTVTATTSASLPTGQGVFLRYTTNNFSTSTVVNMTGSGSTYTASIPSGTNTAGANVIYYVFTSGGTTPPAATDCDLATINLNNNSGSNYSYTVNTPATIYLNNFPAGSATTSDTETPATLNSNLTTTGWTCAGGSGSFIVANGNGNVASSLATSTIANTPYTLTLNVATGYSLSVTSFNLWRFSSQANNTISSITINGTTITSSAITIPTGANASSGTTLGVTNVANAVSGLTGTVTVVLNLANGGSTGSFRLDDFTLNGNVVAVPSPPTLTTPTSSVTSNTTATLGATVTSNNGSALTDRGVVYKAGASGVTIADNKTSELGTSVSAFTKAVTGLTSQTQYVYAGWATNGNGTSLSPEATFRTFSAPATAQPATFSTTAGSSSLVANWGAATFPGSGATQAGYLVIYATGTPTLSSANGTAPAAGVGTLVNITPTTLPTTPALTTTITGLTNGTTYNLLLIPYTWDGTNATTYNYFTTSAKTTTGTPAAVSYTWSGGTSGAWATTTNWTPNSQTGGPAGGDSVTFNTGGNISITSVPTVTLGAITVSTTGTAVTLASPSSGNTTITLSNTGTALSIATGTSLTLVGHTTNSRTMTLAYSGTGNTATIAGTLSLTTSGSGAASYSATNSATTVSGTLSNNNATGTITSTTGNLTISGTGKFSLAGTATVVPTATWATSSTLEFANSYTSSTIVTGLGQTFSNVSVNATGMGASGVIQCNGALVTINKDLNISSTGSGTFSLQAGSSAVTVTIGGVYNQTGGAFDFSAGSTNGATNVNVSGNISVSGSGTISTVGTVRNGAFVFAGTSTQTVTFATPANVTYTNFTVNSGATMKLASNIVLNNSSTANYKGTILVNSGGTFDSGTTFTVTPASTTAGGSLFTLSSGATMATANATGVLGAVPTNTGLTSSFNSGANYIFNGATQTTSAFTTTPTANTINNLTVASTGAVTMSAATTVNGALNLTGGSLDLNALTLTMSATAAQSIAGAAGNTFNITGAANSKLALSGGTSHVVTLSNFGTGTSANLITGSNVNVELNSNTQLDCAGNGTSTSMLTVLGTFTINSATSSNIANAHPPFYGTGSTLVYNATYGRFNEWNATSGPGYPYNVQVNTGTTLDVKNSVDSYKKIAGKFVINGTLNMNGLTVDNGGNGVCLEALGDIENNGTINFSGSTKRFKGVNFINGNTNTTATTNLSTAGGGDLEITGNLTDNANFNANARAVFFTGTGVQTIGGTATGTFNVDYIVSNKAGGSIKLLKDLLTGAPNTGNAITLTGATDIFDLNGFTYTLGTSGQASTISGTGVFKGSSTSKMIINGTGAFGTVRFDQTTPGTTNLLSNLTVNRTSGGIVLGNDLNVSTDIALTDGTIALGTSNLTVGATGTITVSSPSAAKMIIADGSGELRKSCTTNSQANFTFPIGDSTGSGNGAEYTPITSSSSSSTGATFTNAYIAAKVSDAKHSSNNSTTNYLTRYWTVRQNGIAGALFSATLNGTYISGSSADLNGGSGTDSLISSAQLEGTFNQTTNPWVKFTPLSGGTLTVSATLTSGIDSVITGITGANPSATITGGGVSVCPGTNVNLGTTSVVGDPTILYSWSPSTYLSSTTISNPVVTNPASTISYTLTIRDGNGITGTANTTITATTTSTTDGGATWSDGTPSGTKAALYNGSTGTISADMTACALRLSNNASVTVASGVDVTLSGAITVDSGSTFTLNNTANLMQGGTTNSNSGNIVVKRNSSALKRLDYTLWSSPVAGQGLYAFSPYTLPNRFYKYVSSTNTFSNSLGFDLVNLQYPSPLVSPNGVNGTDNNNVTFKVGEGYLIRVPYDHPTTETPWTGTYTGIPNNGDIPVTISLAGEPVIGYGYNAVGNPYPSRLNVRDFIDGNTNITGTLYFWRKTNNSSDSSYATLTKTAYVANGARGGDTGTGYFNTGDEANWVLNIGQGFFVQATSGTTINFTNSMRRSSNSNQFFKSSNTANDVTTSGLYWLNLNTVDNTENIYSQMAVGYSSEGTLDVDRGIDGENINKDFYLTSLIGTGEYTVQGRPDFNDTDIVPLSYKVTTAGNYTISIDHTSGLFSAGTQAIYLKDNVTNTITNLTTPYAFTSAVGTFTNRFEVIYQSQLGVTNPVLTENSVVIYNHDNDFVVNTGNIIMSSIKVFDIRGRLIQQKKGINANQTTINGGLANEVLLVQVTSEDGVTVTKKVVK